MLRFAAVLLALLLTACTGMPVISSQPTPEMTVDQLKALASDKNSAALCGRLQFAGGTTTFVMVNQDRGAIVNGEVTITPDCAVKITNAVPVRVTTTGVTHGTDVKPANQ